MSESKHEADSRARPLAVSHVADFCRRYPGEVVTLFTRVEAKQTVPGYRLRVHIPAGLVVDDYRGPSGAGHAQAQMLADGADRDLYWNVQSETADGVQHEYRMTATIAPVTHDVTLESLAVATAEIAPDDLRSAHESVEITVRAKGEYLKYLPAIYDSDELMGRLLMLFETFWAPIEQQTGNLALYFDPRLTPPDFLPWLAAWLSLVLDERWPEEKRRRLLRAAASLYRRRGTKQAMVEYLQIYTDATAKIVERRANDFQLGLGARLGAGLALGRGNRPHTFEVTLRLPRLEGDVSERKEQATERRKRIEAIIQAEKPAHTAFTLHIESR